MVAWTASPAIFVIVPDPVSGPNWQVGQTRIIAMGLDWNPGSKAKSGHEQEFQELWRQLHARSCFWRSRKVKRFQKITVTAFETLGAPRVGYDDAATEWARKMYPNCKDKSLGEQEFIGRMKGFYVLDLVPPGDGIPRYSNGSLGCVDRHSFRADYLRDCEEIIGQALLDGAYESKLPEETVDYGGKLIKKAADFASAHGIDPLNTMEADDPDAVKFRVSVVLAAGRWCRFWGQRGHWLEAYF
jgi:hypothetical protein